MAVTERVLAAMNTKDAGFFQELGARIAQGRKALGLTQQQVADQLGVAQQTYAHYEVGRVRIAVTMVPVLADLLDLSMEELLLGQPASRPSGRRGPASRLQQQVEAIGQLPRSQQKFVSQMLDTVLAQHAG